MKLTDKNTNNGSVKMQKKSKLKLQSWQETDSDKLVPECPYCNCIFRPKPDYNEYKKNVNHVVRPSNTGHVIIL